MHPHSRSILAASAVCSATLLTLILAGDVKLRHDQLHAPEYDSVSYEFHNVRLYHQIAEKGRVGALVWEAVSNPKYLWRSAPLAVLSPASLLSPLGPLITAAPALLCFAVVVGLAVQRRSESMLAGIVSGVVVAWSPGWLHPSVGIAAFWLDLPAALLIGAAAICVLNAEQARRPLGWLLFSSLLAAFAVLCRSVAAAPALVVLVPLWALHWRRRIRSDYAAREVALEVFKVAALFGMLVGPFLLWHSIESLSYVQAFSGQGQGAGSTAIGGGLKSAAQVHWGGVKRLIPLRGACFLGLLATVGIASRRSRNWGEHVALLWVTLAPPLLTLGILQSTQYLVVAYAVPGVLALSMSLAAPLLRGAGLGRWVGGATMLVSAVLLGDQYDGWRHSQSSPEAAERKALHRELALAIGATGARTVEVIVDDRSSLPVVLVVNRIMGPGAPVLPAGVFAAHEGQWRLRYGSQGVEAVIAGVLAQLQERAELVVISPANSGDGGFSSPTSREVARQLPAAMASTGTWRLVFRLEDDKSGPLLGFLNTGEQGPLERWQAMMDLPVELVAAGPTT